MAVNKVIYGSDTVIDISDATAVASDVASGKYFYDANGVKTLGTASGGISAWTKICEKTYTVNTTGTSASSIETWDTGHDELSTLNEYIYIRVRDTAGKRDGYYYGGDQFFCRAPGGTGNLSDVSRVVIRYADGAFATNTSTRYGIYANNIQSDGKIAIYRRYNATNTLTINGTYKVEVYALAQPDGLPLFN